MDPIKYLVSNKGKFLEIWYNRNIKPELLIPAGDLEKLQTAVRFGADAVYVGAGSFSLRSASQTSFNLKQLKAGVNFAHKHKVRVYLAMNIFAFDNDLPKMVGYLKSAVKLGVDAVIISDPGLLYLIKKNKLKIKLHLSTQANTLNAFSIKFWQEQGISRIVLARELSIKQIQQIRRLVPKIELELFVHGAMCMSYSGRCLLSKHLTGRSANQGDCTHPCRWEYRLKEVTRPHEEFLIEEDKRGTYILNSKDLCLIKKIPELIKSGIDSFKVEGRMKSIYYVAVVTQVYREAIDKYYADPRKYRFDPSWQQELDKTSHRAYTTGFYFNEKDRESIAHPGYIRGYEFVGVVGDHCSKGLEVFSRNSFCVGDQLEVIDPNDREMIKIKIKSIKQGKIYVSKAQNSAKVIIEADGASQISRYSLLRRKK